MTTTPAAIETPTDEAVPVPKPRPTAGNRYQLFDDEEGDYRILEIAPAGKDIPKGSLMPIAEVPGFTDTASAKKFIRASGELFEGKQLMIIKGIEICSVQVETVSKVAVNFKQKKPKGKAASAGEEGG